jgi:hypothetical protein
MSEDLEIIWNSEALARDEIALQVAKERLGWDKLTEAERIARTRELLVKAQRVKDGLYDTQ